MECNTKPIIILAFNPTIIPKLQDSCVQKKATLYLHTEEWLRFRRLSPNKIIPDVRPFRSICSLTPDLLVPKQNVIHLFRNKSNGLQAIMFQSQKIYCIRSNRIGPIVSGTIWLGLRGLFCLETISFRDFFIQRLHS